MQVLYAECQKDRKAQQSVLFSLSDTSWHFIFYFDCFEDKHIDFLLQSVF